MTKSSWISRLLRKPEFASVAGAIFVFAVFGVFAHDSGYEISIRTSGEENGMKRLLSSRKDASRGDVSEPCQGVLRRPNPL